jgi:hypothetical protein
VLDALTAIRALPVKGERLVRPWWLLDRIDLYHTL